MVGPSAMTAADVAATGALNSRAPRLSVISGAEQWYGLATAIATAGTFNTVRVLHKNLTGKTVSGLRLYAPNHAWAGTASDGTASGPKERQNTNPITIHSAIEFSGTKVDQQQYRTPVRWGGQFTLTLTPTTEQFAAPSGVVSDPVPGAVPPGGTFYERSAITVATNGQQFYSAVSLRGGTTGFGADSGEGFSTNSIAERVFNNTSGDVNIAAPQFTPGWSAMFILGVPTDGTVASSVFIAGDSIVTKVDDAGYGYLTGGWALRAFANYPHALATLPGEMELAAVSLKNWATKFDGSQYFTHVLWAYGRNDLSYYMGAQSMTAAVAFAAMKAVRLQAAKMFMMPRSNGYPGAVFIGATILPAPTSNDGFKTYTGQARDVYEAGRVLFNDWMRDPSAAGFVQQANAQVAGIVGAGVARVADPCLGLEVNASGVPTLGTASVNAGLSPIVTQTFDTGTSSGSNPGNAFNDTTKAWTPNAFKGAELRIIAGTGAGQYRGIGGNTATQLLIADAWTTAPDATSTYEITDAPGWNGVHPGTRGAILSASGINADALMVQP